MIDTINSNEIFLIRQRLKVRMRDVEDVTASSYFSEKNIKHVPDLIMDGDTTTGLGRRGRRQW